MKEKREKVEYPLVSIQILNWNRAEETQRAILSAYNQSYPNIEIVVVDNGSTDNSVSLTRLNFPEVKILELEKNYGCPGGRNRGMDYCSGEFIFYLDNDGILHKEAVMNAFNSINLSPTIGIVTGVVYDFDSPDQIDCESEVSKVRPYYFNNFFGGICMHRKAIYDKVGRYPEHFHYGAEEMYMTLRIFQTEYKIVKDESVVLWHKRGENARNRAAELTQSYFNKLYTAINLFPQGPAIKFGLYFIPTYFYYAWKGGFLFEFIARYSILLPKTLKAAIRNREPVSKESYRAYRKFKVEFV